MGCQLSTERLNANGVYGFLPTSDPIESSNHLQPFPIITSFFHDGGPSYSLSGPDEDPADPQRILLLCGDENEILYLDGQPASQNQFFFECPGQDEYLSSTPIEDRVYCSATAPPTATPSVAPSTQPSAAPSMAPSTQPSAAPSMAPTTLARANRNDQCQNAFPLVFWDDDLSFEGQTLGARVSTNLFGLGIDAHGPSVWFSFQGTGETYRLTMDCDQDPWDASVRVFSGSCDEYGGDYYGGRGFCLDDSKSIDGIQTQEGKQYLVLVEGFTDNQDGLPDYGHFQLSISQE